MPPHPLPQYITAIGNNCKSLTAKTPRREGFLGQVCQQYKELVIMTAVTFNSPAAMTVTAAGSVISRDSTRIAYRQFGAGPGLVLVHGAMESGLSHRELAEALAERFSVTIYDRRGRGASG